VCVFRKTSLTIHYCLILRAVISHHHYSALFAFHQIVVVVGEPVHTKGADDACAQIITYPPFLSARFDDKHNRLRAGAADTVLFLCIV
jgi:hypothetical protein